MQSFHSYVLGRCTVAVQSGGAEISPVVDGGGYLFDYHGDDPRYKETLSSGQFFSGAKVTLIKAPAHGKVVREEGQWSSETDYHYFPNEGYVGQDRFVMQVEKNGVKVRIHYLIETIDDDAPTTIRGDDGVNRSLYCNPGAWKISSSATPDKAPEPKGSETLTVLQKIMSLSFPRFFVDLTNPNLQALAQRLSQAVAGFRVA